MHSLETQEQFLRLRAKGKSIRSIAAELNLSISTVSEWNRKYSLQVADARRDELESAIDEFAVAKIRRVRVIARAFNKVEAYLRNCYYIQQNTEVFHLLMKLDRYLDMELCVPVKNPDNSSQQAKIPGKKRRRRPVEYILAIPPPDDNDAEPAPLVPRDSPAGPLSHPIDEFSAVSPNSPSNEPVPPDPPFVGRIL